MPFLKLIVDGKVRPIDSVPKDEHICNHPLPGTWDWPMFEAGTIWQCPECKKINVWGRSSFEHIKKDRFKNCFWYDVIDGIKNVS